MAADKLRVLYVGNSSYLSSGYATYSFEVLSRLHADGRFEVAELGQFGGYDDPRRHDLPWRHYPVVPDPADPDEREEYARNPGNEYGAWRFERTCLDFRPDAVFGIDDWWGGEFLFRSPLRRHFHLAYMPTCDAVPLMDQWVDSYRAADAVFGYTDWAVGVLRGYGVPALGSAPPGADVATFRPPADRAAHRAALGLPADALVVGSVMRNQPRKLFPDLIEAFAALRAGGPDGVRDRAYLYLHTAHPDQGWDLPRLVLEAGAGDRVLFTYWCRACGHAFPSLLADAKAVCPKCCRHAATMPDSSRGLSRAQLAAVYQAFDCFVQYSVCFPPGTEVKTSSGWQTIERLSPGDRVWTHEGNWKQVEKNLVRPYRGKVVTVRAQGCVDPVTATPEHPFLALTAAQTRGLSGRDVREQCRIAIDAGGAPPEPAFVRVGELVKGDFLVVRIDDTCEDVTQLDYAAYVDDKDWVNDQTVVVRGGKQYPRFVEVDEEFCRFLGLYAADGSTSLAGSGQIQVTAHRDEVENQQLARSVMTRMCGQVASLGFYRSRQAATVSASGKPVARLMAELCSKGPGKQVPDWATRLPEAKLRAVLQGVFIGDGHYSTDRHVSVLSVTSRKLADQVQHMLRRLRLRYSFAVSKKPAGRLDQYRFEVGGNVAALDLTCSRRKSANFYYGPWHFVQVKEVSTSDYDGMVYNCEVEGDHTYSTRVGCVHNCEGFGLPQVEAAACGAPVFAVDYSAMSDVVRKVNGFPVRVQRFAREPATGRRVAYPDNQDLVDQLGRYLAAPAAVRARREAAAREGALAHYTYDRTARVWADHFAALTPRRTWAEPARIHTPVLDAPPDLADPDWVRWAFGAVLGRPDLADSLAALRLTRDLQQGMTYGYAAGSVFSDAAAHGKTMFTKLHPFDREKALALLAGEAERANFWELERCKALGVTP